MHIALVTPGLPGVRTGNRSSALDYQAIFEELGHQVTASSSWNPEGDADLLVALHASKSHPSITRFRAAHPHKPIVVVLTGTDIYPEPEKEALESMAIADRLVSLQTRALDKIPSALRSQNRTIIQSATPSEHATPERSQDPFEVVVAGHLRDVKDPLRAALASRLLPRSSKIRIRHVGSILEEKYRAQVERELHENPRYDYLGPLEPEDLKALLARSQLTVLSSLNEGGARIVGESIVAGTPVLSSRIDGVLGLLGEDYPGYFPVRDTKALADLMSKAETDLAFRKHLHDLTLSYQDRFNPDQQASAWENLLTDLA